MLVAVADQGFFDSFKEAGALAKHLAKARENTQSPLIRRLAEGRGTGFGLTSSPAEIESETLEALRQARQLLEKTPDELEDYRSFVVDIARSVSSAAGGGDEAEAQAVEKIESALGAGGAALSATPLRPLGAVGDGPEI
jgi:hypothetical protein